MNKGRIIELSIRTIKIAFLIIVSVIIIVFVIFAINRNKISERIIKYTNTITQGELLFNKISISPFVQFPNISITMDSVKYYEQNYDTIEAKPSLIASFKELHIAFDFQELLAGKLKLSQIFVEQGNVNIVQYADSSLNITNALMLIESDSLNQISNSDSTTNSSVEFLLGKARIRNISVNYTNMPNKVNSKFILKNGSVSFSRKNDTLISEIDAVVFIKKHKIPNLINIKNQKLSVKGSTLINRKDQWAKINPSIIKIGQSSLNINGRIEKSDGQNHVNLYFNSSDKNLNLINLILEEKAKQSFQTGNVNLSGHIKGFLNNNIPNITCNYTISNVTIPIPESEKKISNLNVTGTFNSGIASNFSQAVLNIDTIYALLPNGYINGQVELKNFNSPYINYSIGLQTNLHEFGSILSIPGIESLQGKIKLESKFKGHLANKAELVNREFSFIDIYFDSVGLTIPNIANVQYLNGNISGNIDSLCFNNLETLIGNSDIHLNGSVFNLSTLIINQDKEVLAALSISSSKFDLAKLLHFKPNIGNGFPYQISNLNLNVQATSNYNNFHNAPLVPIINFQINKLDATIEKLMSPISITQCEFILKDKDSTLHLDFNNLNIELTHGSLTGNADFYSPFTSENYLTFNGQIFNVNAGRVFKKENKAISKFLDAKLNAAINCTLNFSPNKSKPFKHTNVELHDFVYQNTTDTFNIKLLQLNTGEVQWNTQNNKNPLATISSDIYIQAEELSSSIFNLDKLAYKITAKQGELSIIPEHAHLFGKKGEGRYVISPFSINPSYKLYYQVNNFQASKLLSSFNEDTILVGNMDMELNMSFSGKTKEEMLSNLNGNLLFKSTDLTMYGLDLDNTIKKVSRTQRFSLVDLAATIIAGPVGLVLSKGSDYTRLIINNGEATHINEFKTEWKIINGVAHVNDVAFATPNNRIALNGNVNFNSSALNFIIALVDETGCSILNQKLVGSIKHPKAGDLVIINSILAPVTNLVEDVISKCDTFYIGSVQHPTKIK